VFLEFTALHVFVYDLPRCAVVLNERRVAGSGWVPVGPIGEIAVADFGSGGWGILRWIPPPVRTDLIE
jgi:hypothetical protein